MKKWNDIYELPLRQDEYGSWVYDNKSNFVFQFEKVSESNRKDILDILNGVREPESIDHTFTYEDRYIVMDGEREIILIRGWGNLTGTGAHNLPTEEAANIQDTFAAWIIEKLTKIE